MGKEKIAEIIKMSERKDAKPSSNIEVEVAKLITACTLMPTMKVGCDIVKGQNGQLWVNFFQENSRSNHKLPESLVGLNGGLMSAIELFGASSKIHRYLKEENLLNSDNSLSLVDHILWTALDDTARRVRYSNEERDALIDRVTDKSLQINTLRKLLNSSKKGEMSEYESVLTTILATIDFYTNSNTPDNPLSRLSVNERSYFSHLEKLSKINSVIRTNCAIYKNLELNNYLCARNSTEDKKASYLAGKYQSQYDSVDFSAKKIFPRNADFLDGVGSQMSI